MKIIYSFSSIFHILNVIIIIGKWKINYVKNLVIINYVRLNLID